MPKHPLCLLPLHPFLVKLAGQEGAEKLVISGDMCLFAGLTAVEAAAANKNVHLKQILESRSFFLGSFILPVKSLFGSSNKQIFSVVAPVTNNQATDKRSFFPLVMSCYR